MLRTTLLAALAAVMAAGLAQAAAAPVPIGLAGLPHSADADGVKIAKELGLNFIVETTTWDEPKEGDYPWAEGSDDSFAARLEDLKRQGYTVCVTLKNVEDDKKQMPLYLEGRPFDDPQVLRRWVAFLKEFVGRYGDGIDYLNFGHQINGYFPKHEDEWAGFVKFVGAGAMLVRKERPKMSVGVVLKDTDDPAKFWRDLAPACTHFALTYTVPCSVIEKNPTSSALNPKQPTFFGKTLDTMLQLAGRRKVLLVEVGCASHASLDSSPEIQAQFIKALFAWLKRSESRVAAFSYAIDKDWPYEATKGALKQMFGDEIMKYRGFVRLLSSRGLRDEEGNKKPAFEAFKAAIEQYRTRR